MNAREFYEAVKRMREAGKAYYACRASMTDPHKQELLKAAMDAEKIVDNEILRVEAILSKQNDPQQSLNLEGGAS